MKPVDVFQRIDLVQHRCFIDALRQRKLNENAVHFIISVQLSDDRDQLVRRCIGPNVFVQRPESEFLGCPHLIADVNGRCRVVADAHGRKARNDAECGDGCAYLVFDRVGYFLTA